LSCKLKSLAFCYHVSVVCRVFVTDVLWLNGKSGKSAIVPLDRAIATFYRLSVVTMALSAAVWQQLSMHYFNLLVAYLKNESDRAKFFYSNQLMSHMEHDVSNLGCSPLFLLGHKICVQFVPFCLDTKFTQTFFRKKLLKTSNHKLDFPVLLFGPTPIQHGRTTKTRIMTYRRVSKLFLSSRSSPSLQHCRSARHCRRRGAKLLLLLLLLLRLCID